MWADYQYQEQPLVCLPSTIRLIDMLVQKVVTHQTMNRYES